MDFQEIGNLITNNGVAVFVAVYSLMTLNKNIKENTEETRSTRQLIELMFKKEGVN